MRDKITLRADATPEQQFQRDRSLAINRRAYRWVHLPELPPFCDGVPQAEAITPLQADRTIYDLTMSALNVGVSMFGAMRKKATTIAHYDAFYALRPKPNVAGVWKDDAEFARQRLDGVNPLTIRRVTAPPDNFPVTDAGLRGVLPDGVTLAQLGAEQRLYLCDYQLLADVPTVLGRYLTAPMALFWVDDQRRLMPLAIQLGQRPSSTTPIFTPADDRWLWLTARMHLQSAEAAYHETVIHLLRTHLIMETIWVATVRSLPPQHPIHELLQPHFEGTIKINDSARRVMLAPGGPFDVSISVGCEGAYWLIHQAYKALSFADLHPIDDLVARGVDDHHALPGYHYRDDVELLWHAIGTFVRDVLADFYLDADGSFVHDAELDAWVHELSDAECGNIVGLPLKDGRIATFDDLVRIVQQVLFSTSCEHSAVNNGQYDIFGYLPNCPGALFLPAPSSHEQSSEAEYCYALPPTKSVADQLTLVHLLSMPTVNRIGDYPTNFFQGHLRVRYAIDRFRGHLDQVSFAIDARNASLRMPYTYLDPSQIARSINA
jgi:hypothetical protein